VKRPLCLLDQFRDVVKAKPRPEIAEIACSYLEDSPRAFISPVRQPTPQRFVDDITERPSGTARLRLQLCRHVGVQRKSGSHALMLQNRHHMMSKTWSHVELRDKRANNWTCLYRSIHDDTERMTRSGS
jgi:hypothetical protein